MAQPNCSSPATGFIPINDLGKGTFTNAWGIAWEGGLYPQGSNFLPSAHKLAGMQLASQVQCLDATGKPDALNGRIVWLSIGMSNGTQETQQFIPIAKAFAGKNPKLILVDGAQGGQTAANISSPENVNYTTFWNTVNTRLANSGVTAKQVQVIWLKEADVANVPIRVYYDSIVVRFKRIANELKIRFPNVRLCYMASRISARYASTNLNPEPFSYYTGWAIKKVIEDQINGDAQLVCSGIDAKSPWLSWGTYTWTDGSSPQRTNPTVFWNCETDFQNDGTHPSTAGAKKVGNLLLNFFSTDSTSVQWFTGKGCPMPTSTGDRIIPETYMYIYPNPVRDHLTIQLTQEISNGKLYLYDYSGRSIFKLEKLNGQQFTIESDRLPGGIYLVQIYSDDKLYNSIRFSK